MEAYPMDHLGLEHQFDQVGGVTGVRYGDPKKLFAQFFWKSVQDKAATIKANGRPIFKPVLYLKVIIPGLVKTEQIRPAREEDKTTFAGYYDYFLHNNSKPPIGTPLAEWPIITRTQIESLTAWGLRTIEELAALADAKCEVDIELLGMRRNAQIFLEQAAGRNPAEALAAENDQLRSQVEALTEQVKKLQVAIELMGERKNG